MAEIKKINTDLQIEAGLLDGDGNSGTANQILISTGTGIDWVDGSGSGIIGGPYLPLAGGTMTGATLHGDNVMSRYGTGNDFSIYHNGTDGYLQNEVGNLIIPVGNVGINTTNPIDKLNVHGGTGDAAAQQPKIAVTRTSSTGNVLAGKIILTTKYSDPTNHGNLAFQVKTTASAGESSAYYTNAITIDGKNANVGIGTTNPRDILEIEGNMRFVNGEDHLLIKPNNDIQGADFIVGDGVDPADTPIMSLDGLSGGKVTIQTVIGSTANADKTTLDIQGSQGQLFSVTDDLSGDIFSVADISGVPIMNVNSNGVSYFDGPVGIGVPTPSTPYYLQMTSGAGANGDCILGISADADGTTPQSSPKIVMSKNGNANFFVLEMDDNHRTVFANTQGHYFQSGNVGIGTTLPSTKLEVAGHVTINSPTGASQTSYGLRLRKTNSSSAVQAGGEILASPYPNNTNAANLIFKTADTVANLTQRMVIDGVGNVGIGTGSPDSTLDVNGEIGASGDGYYINGMAWALENSSILTLGDWDGNEFETRIMDENSNEVLRVTDGNVGINETNPAQKLHINSGRILISNNTTPFYIKVNSNYKSWVHHISSDDGYIFAPSTADGGETWDWSKQTKIQVDGTVKSGNFILSSDERIKTKIKDLSCNNINVNWKSFEIKGNEGEYRAGVIAQELEKSHPEFVNTDDKGFKSVKYIDLLIAKIAELEARLEKLEK